MMFYEYQVGYKTVLFINPPLQEISAKAMNQIQLTGREE